MRARDRSRGGTFLRRLSLAAILSVIGVLALAALATAGDGKPSQGWHKGKPGKGYSKVATCPKGTVRFKIEPVVSGTKGDGTFSVTITRTDSSAGESFDFTSNLPVTTVYVKGGPKANRYYYSPPVMSGTGLHAPKNWHSGKWYGLSNVVFCYKPGSPPSPGLKVEVSKTAKTTFTRAHQWKIGKWAKPSKWNLFEGDSGTSKYVVAVKKKGYADSNWAVSGTIAVKNPTTTAATVTSVTDTISGGINATVSCGVTFPYTLAAGATLNCSYSAALPDGASRTNTATVATSGSVGGGSGSAAVTFGAPTTVTNGTITVNDSNGMSWTFSDSGYKTYSRKFTCGNGGTFTNTATIAQTGQSASATVVVKCWELEVSKDVKTATLKKWDWSITKTASPTTLNLNEGQTGSVSYTVKLDAQAETKGAFASGKIRVHNPSPLDAVLESVTDVVSPNIAAKVDCDVKFPYELESGDTLECKYAVVLPDASTRTNTATATIRNHDYAYGHGHDHDDDHGKDKDDDHGKKDDDKKDDGKKGHGSPSGTTSFTGTAPVSFTGGGAKELDRCVEVVDTRKGKLGTVCADDANKAFTYTLTFGTKGTNANVIVGCGETTYPNTASFETKDTEKKGTANASVTIKVACTTQTPPTPSPTIDLVLDKVATSPTAFNGTVTYTLKVTNKGPGTATNVQLADPAPAGVAYTSATSTQGTCTVTKPLVTCSLGSLAAGQTATVTIKAKATKVGPLSNTATVVGEGGSETNQADNSDTAQTTVAAPLKPPSSKKGKKTKARAKPAAAACLLMTVRPKSITVDDRPDRVRVLVTAAKARQRGVRVVVRGAGVSKAGRTARNGVAVVMINARRPGVITVTARERNRQVCGTRRIGVVAAFVAPLTG